mmetsp:Transcript_16449/g.51038  ORF Transcript_16449/g.51038 Transcript_16449/m.51038 type:complete len:204 (+) Transcript_16449:301-912(+)
MQACTGSGDSTTARATRTAAEFTAAHGAAAGAYRCCAAGSKLSLRVYTSDGAAHPLSDTPELSTVSREMSRDSRNTLSSRPHPLPTASACCMMRHARTHVLPVMSQRAARAEPTSPQKTVPHDAPTHTPASSSSSAAHVRIASPATSLESVTKRLCAATMWTPLSSSRICTMLQFCRSSAGSTCPNHVATGTSAAFLMNSTAR